MVNPAVLVTCEHAVQTIPERWRFQFEDFEEVLGSHQGWDPGALELARTLAKGLEAPCFSAEVSRLLIDHNRSPHNRTLWSNWSSGLPVEEKKALIEAFYDPFRKQTADWIAGRLAGELKVIHLSVHSFTPFMDGKEREVDIGLLYDPGRPEEAFFSTRWKTFLQNSLPRLRVRLNTPYRGGSDSHLTTYRNTYTSRDYIGIELEVNQALIGPGKKWSALRSQIVESLLLTLQESSLDE